METPYRLTYQEKALTNILLSIFYYNGFEKRKLPKIFESDELITIEIVNEWIKKTGLSPDDLIFPHNKDNVANDQDDKDNIKKYKYVIELLGMYFPATQSITLYTKRIEEAAKGLNVSTDALRQVVLLHEIGHWITHKLHYNRQCWEIAKYNSASTEVHEGWAQLLAWWVVKNISKLKRAFDRLNKEQIQQYHVWVEFKHSTIKSLLVLRELESPTKTTWESCDKHVAQNPEKSIHSILIIMRGENTGRELNIAN